MIRSLIWDLIYESNTLEMKVKNHPTNSSYCVYVIGKNLVKVFSVELICSSP